MPSSKIPVALLAGILAGCQVTVPKAMPRELPPEALLAPCPDPKRELRTNRDLAEYILDLRQALANCDNDKTALREWAKE